MENVENGSNNKNEDNKKNKRNSAPKRKATSNPDIEERVVAVNRVAKVVKGGRRFCFSALIIGGDKKGKVVKVKSIEAVLLGNPKVLFTV